MKYERFINLDQMITFAVQHANSLDCVVSTDHSIYSDDRGLSYRPSVLLVRSDYGETISLRWFAFCDVERVSNIGWRARREANEAAAYFAEKIKRAIEKEKVAS